MRTWTPAVLILALLLQIGCSHLILRPDDDVPVKSAKVAGRVMLGVLTVPLLIGGMHSEFTIAQIKNSAPITDGFHTTLPAEKVTVVVLGDHHNATAAAVTWLQKRGLVIVERTGLYKVFNEQEIRLTHTSDDEAAYLKVGKLIGASLIVFVDTATSGGAISTSSMYVGQGSGYGQSYSTTVSSSGVSVRGVDVQTGSLLWTGHARYPEKHAGGAEDALVKLTCQALATAWGFRASGDDFIPSQEMCDLRAVRPPQQH